MSQRKASAVVVLVIGVAAMASLVMSMPGLEQTVAVERAAAVKVPESLTLAGLPESVGSANSVPVAAVEPSKATASLPPAAPAVVSATSAASANAPAACQYNRAALPQISPPMATKPSRYVFMVASADVTVCVVDANQQVTPVKLKAGESQSVYGTAPWQVSSAKLSNVQIYFQGSRVTLPEGADQGVTLIEKSN